MNSFNVSAGCRFPCPGVIRYRFRRARVIALVLTHGARHAGRRPPCAGVVLRKVEVGQSGDFRNVFNGRICPGWATYAIDFWGLCRSPTDCQVSPDSLASPVVESSVLLRIGRPETEWRWPPCPVRVLPCPRGVGCGVAADPIVAWERRAPLPGCSGSRPRTGCALSLVCPFFSRARACPARDQYGRSAPCPTGPGLPQRQPGHGHRRHIF